MKKLKYMSMMGLAALLLTTWAACSDDTDASGGENPEEARAYTTVTIAVPNGVAETRASDPTADTDDTNMDIGLKDEYKVTKANLYLFPGGTGSSFGSAKLRPASRAAAAMFARIRAMFSAIVISVPILLSSGRPAAISLSAANHLSII